jgi:hypothetical protein
MRNLFGLLRCLSFREHNYVGFGSYVTTIIDPELTSLDYEKQRCKDCNKIKNQPFRVYRWQTS